MDHLIGAIEIEYESLERNVENLRCDTKLYTRDRDKVIRPIEL